MNRSTTSSLFSLPIIPRVGILVGSLVFISLFFPSGLQFDYSYSLGNKWLYDDLKAPFSFPLLKMDQDLEKEKKEVLADLTPYFRIDSAVLKTQILRLEEQLNAQTWFSSISEEEKDQVISLSKDILNVVYQKGLIEDTGLEADPQTIELMNGPMDIGQRSVDELYTSKRALQYLIDQIYDSSLNSDISADLLRVLEDILRLPNVFFDETLTEQMKNRALTAISPYLGKIDEGQVIVRRGQIIDKMIFNTLNSYKLKYSEQINQNKNGLLIYLGYFLLTLSLLGTFSFYTLYFAKDVYDNIRHFLLLFLILSAFVYLSIVIDSTKLIDLYFVPFCIIPIIILNFFSTHLAFFAHVVVILLVSMLLSLDYQFVIVQLMVGMVTIVTKLKTRHLSDYFKSLLTIAIVYFGGFLSLELLQKGIVFDVYNEDGILIESGVRWSVSIWILLNILLTLLSYPLIPLLEKAFGLTSDITLLELSDMDQPLLKRLSLEAPGTLQHSLQVANLCEAAAKKIGGNALLLKVAALYHDIGKIEQAQHFIENQSTFNPHENLTAAESAEVIIQHVEKGVRLAQKHRLPSVLIDFIKTHHGTTSVAYFYNQHKEQVLGENQLPEAAFCYPGPKPTTKEQSILMIADSIEAASKSLQKPTADQLDQLVDGIVDAKIQKGQLTDSQLSFDELEQVKTVLKDLLKSIYHVRVEYPGQ